MISLAAGGGDAIFLIAMLVFGVINWLANKGKEGQAPKKPGPLPRGPQPQRPAAGDAEAERMRRFLEALGVPADAPPQQPPPMVRPQQPRKQRKPKTVAPPPIPAARSLDEAGAPTAPVADIRMPELKTPELPVFETVSSRVMADPNGDFATVSSTVAAVPGSAAKTVQPRAARGVETGAIRAALRSPESLRTALILREVLGPPLALRTRDY